MAKKNFKVGDKIKVISKNDTLDCGWVSPDMDSLVGKVGVIIEISERGNYRIEKSFPWWIPKENVELVDRQLYLL